MVAVKRRAVVWSCCTPVVDTVDEISKQTCPRRDVRGRGVFIFGPGPGRSKSISSELHIHPINAGLAVQSSALTKAYIKYLYVSFMDAIHKCGTNEQSAQLFKGKSMRHGTYNL